MDEFYTIIEGLEGNEKEYIRTLADIALPEYEIEGLSHEEVEQVESELHDIAMILDREGVVFENQEDLNDLTNALGDLKSHETYNDEKIDKINNLSNLFTK